MSEELTMPIIHTSFRVVWKPSPADRVRAERNHGGQSLEKLAGRGGLDWTELDAILANEDWNHHPREEGESMKRVNLILRQRAQ